jgi:hypothetical protein
MIVKNVAYDNPNTIVCIVFFSLQRLLIKPSRDQRESLLGLITWRLQGGIEIRREMTEDPI